jgi:metacaspase-1
VASGLSLHIGVDRTDPDHYAGLKTLRGAERDARSMAQLAEAQAFERRVVLVGGDATLDAVRGQIARAAEQLRSGDTYLLSFAGHGGAVPDVIRDRPGGVHRTMCLYDQQLLEPLLYADLSRFRAGVRVVFVNDSCPCHAVMRAGWTSEGDIRAMPGDLALMIYRSNRDTYDGWQYIARELATTGRPASPVLLLDACHDLQDARENAYHGKFTSALLTVWNGGRYLLQPRPSYRDLLARVAEVIADANQVPKLSIAIGAATNRFAEQRPFVVGA